MFWIVAIVESDERRDETQHVVVVVVVVFVVFHPKLRANPALRIDGQTKRTLPVVCEL